MNVTAVWVVTVIFTTYNTGNVEVGIMQKARYIERKQCEEHADKVKANLDKRQSIMLMQAHGGIKVETRCAMEADLKIPNCGQTSEIWRTVSNDIYGNFACCEQGRGIDSRGCRKFLYQPSEEELHK
jgi:hypothetical protein